MPVKQRTTTARRLRRNATEAEKRLWRALRELDPEGGFRRQHPVGLYIVDFACPRVKLAIELDGGQHAERSEADAARTCALAQRGYRVIRFWNGEVMNNLAGVLAAIELELKTGRDG